MSIISTRKLQKRITQSLSKKDLSSSHFELEKVDNVILDQNFLVSQSKSRSRLASSSKDAISPERDSSKNYSVRQSLTQSEFKFGNTVQLLQIQALPTLLLSDPLFDCQQTKRGQSEILVQDRHNSVFKKIHMHNKQQSNPVNVMNNFNQDAKSVKSFRKLKSTLPDLAKQDSDTKRSLGVKLNLSEYNNKLTLSHKMLTKNLQMVCKEVIEGIKLNHIIVKNNIENQLNQQTSREYEQNDELIFLIMETLKNEEKNIIGQSTERQESSKDKIKLIQKSLKSYGSLISQILVQLSKKNVFWSYICDTMWKVVVQIVDSALQIIQQEKECTSRQYTAEDQQRDIEFEQLINQQHSNEVNQLHQGHNKAHKHNEDQIQHLQAQLATMKREFEDFRLSQDENTSLENASKTMIQVKSQLKDLQQTIKTLDEGVLERDTFMASSLSQLIQFHKTFKNEDDFSIKSQIQLKYDLYELTVSQTSDIGQVIQTHPFYPYLAYNDQHIKSQEQQHILEVLKIENVEEFLVFWYNNASYGLQQKIQTEDILLHSRNSPYGDREQVDTFLSPAQLFVQYLEQNIIKQILKSKLHVNHDGSYIIQQQLSIILNFLKDQTQDDENIDVTQEGIKLKQFCLFFCHLFGVLKMNGLSMRTFQQVLVLQAQFQRQEEILDEPAQVFHLKENKLKWDIRTINNINDHISKLQPIHQIALSWFENSINLASLLIKIALHFEIQQMNIFNNIFTEVQEKLRLSSHDKIINQCQDLCMCMIECFSKYFNCSEFDQSICTLIILTNYDKFMKFNKSNQKQWKEFNQEQWKQFAKNTLDLIWAIYKKSPQILKSSFKSNLEHQRLQEQVKILLLEHAKNSEQVMMKQTPRSQKASVYSREGASAQKAGDPSISSSPVEKKNLLLKLLKTKVTQIQTMQK